MQERNAQKLLSLGCNQRSKLSIMSDIYGTQNDVLLQNGLVNALDGEDFDIKLESLKTVWKNRAPGFHDWFKKNRSENFKASLVLSSRESLGIEGRFYTNGLELKHKLQEKRLREAQVPREVLRVTEELQKWSEEFYLEETRAICNQGKYHLAPGYDQFHVDPVRWNRWGPERQTQHVTSFRQFVPKSYDSYKKPNSAGKKTSPKSKKRRAELPEAELFVDHVSPSDQTSSSSNVFPLHLTRAGQSSDWRINFQFYFEL